MVAALAQTAPIFYYTWRENAMFIYKAVAPRTFSNLTDAERLVDMQEEAEPTYELHADCEMKWIIRVRRLLFNARCVSAAANSWVDVCQIHKYRGRGEDPQMRPSELARFEHAFYCVWTVGVMRRAPHLQNQASVFLDECSPRELFRLDEAALWAKCYNHNDFGSLGLDLQDEVWRTGCDLVSKRWSACWSGRGGMPAPEHTPLGFFAFFDNTQRFVDFLPNE